MPDLNAINTDNPEPHPDWRVGRVKFTLVEETPESGRPLGSLDDEGNLNITLPLTYYDYRAPHLEATIHNGHTKFAIDPEYKYLMIDVDSEIFYQTVGLEENGELPERIGITEVRELMEVYYKLHCVLHYLIDMTPRDTEIPQALVDGVVSFALGETKDGIVIWLDNKSVDGFTKDQRLITFRNSLVALMQMAKTRLYLYQFKDKIDF
jgi:hypothetical protein